MVRTLSTLHRALVDDLAQTKPPMLTDPVVMGAAVAASLDYHAPAGPNHYLDLAITTAELMPASATPFERGIALGAAIVLAMDYARLSEAEA